MVGINLIGGLVSKVLPEAGKIIDNLHTSDDERAAAKQKLEELLVSAEQSAQKEVSARWEADMKSGNFLSMNIRPLTLIFLTIVFTIMSFTDGNIGAFTIGEAYKPIYQTLLITCYAAYFSGRTIEKVKKSS